MSQEDGFYAQQRDEHVAENIQAKRTLGYVYNPETGQNERQTNGLKGGNTILFAKVDTASSGDTQIVAASTGKKIKLLSSALVCNGNVSIKWRSGTTDLSGAIPCTQYSGYVLPASAPGMGHYLETASNTALNLNLSSAVQVSGHISYYVE